MTQHVNPQNFFLDTAAAVFTECTYSDIQTDDIVRCSGGTADSFFNVFAGKSEWGVGVIDARINQALEQEQQAPEGETSPAPRTRLLVHLGLLEEVSAQFPGITRAIIDERTVGRKQYGELLPRYYGEVIRALQDGQTRCVFRDDMSAAAIADFTLDRLAMAHAVHLYDPTAKGSRLLSLVLDGYAARE